MRAASFLAASTLAVIAAGAVGRVHDQGTADVDVLRSDDRTPSCRRRASARTRAPAVTSPTRTGNAFGNLDLSSYAGVNRRRDLLLDYGPYQQPSLLVKNVPPVPGRASSSGTARRSTSPPTSSTPAGRSSTPTASGYDTLAALDRERRDREQHRQPAGRLRARRRASDHAPDAGGRLRPRQRPDRRRTSRPFTTGVEPVSRATCAAGNCHGTPINALYLTCGNIAARDPLELLRRRRSISRRPRSRARSSEGRSRPSQGGSYHEGGPLFTSVQDPNYQALLQWAQAHGPLRTMRARPGVPLLRRRRCSRCS